MKYFDLDEFTCKCGCGQARMDGEFLLLLDAAREAAGIPFIINSGFRCEKHNKNVGSTSTNHTRGLAVDVACTDSLSRFKILKALFSVGFKRIGLHKNFIHCDTNTLPDAVWFY